MHYEKFDCTLYTVGRAGITVHYAERTTECCEHEGVCRGRDLTGLKFLLSNFEDAKTKQLSPLKYQRHADRTARRSREIAEEMWTPLTL